MSFSKKKFASFSQEKRRKELFCFLQKIEEQWTDEQSKAELIDEYQALSPLAEPEFAKVDFTSRRSLWQSLTKLETLHQISKSDYQILSQDGKKSYNNHQELPLVLILDNLRSAFNVGAILRTAECFNIEKVAFCGVTPDLQNQKVKKTSMGCWQHLKTENYNSTSQAIETYRKQGYAVFALETTTASLPLATAEFEQPTALVLGNEALGIDKQTLLLCDKIYQIELGGWKNSLNVGICCGIALYQLSQKISEKKVLNQ